MKLFLIAPASHDFKDVLEAIKNSVFETGASFTDVGINIDERDDLIKGINELLVNRIHETIKGADIILADISANNPNVMYELGIARTLNKPIIIFCETGSIIPFDLNNFQVIYYDRLRLHETLSTQLKSILSSSSNKESIISAIVDRKQSTETKTVFVSYTNIDLEFLNRLKVHLKPFEKTNHIELWSDTKIKAGDKWKQQIEIALKKSAIAILLISADFLASDFIIDNELPPLLKAAEEKGKIILSVIVKPCRFLSYENLSKFQAINDPKRPLSNMTENEREQVYVNIAEFIESLLKINTTCNNGFSAMLADE